MDKRRECLRFANLTLSFGRCLAGAGKAPDKRLLPVVKLNFYFCRLDVTHRVSVLKIPEKQRPGDGRNIRQNLLSRLPKAVAALPRQRRTRRRLGRLN